MFLRTVILLLTVIAFWAHDVRAQCPDGKITVEIHTDNSGAETTWQLIDLSDGSAAAAGGPYSNNVSFSYDICVTSGQQYAFRINDSGGNGICCANGNGYFKVYNCSTLVDSGGVFVGNYTTSPILAMNCGGGGVVCVTTCQPGAMAPVNDDCIDAIDLGILPVANPCDGSPTQGEGQPMVYNFSNICATPSNPPIAMSQCANGTNMPVNGTDVWFEVEITGTILEVELSGGLNNPGVALYEATGCLTPSPKECITGTNGYLHYEFVGLWPTRYYLQVSGGGTTDQCDFTLSLEGKGNCRACLVESRLTATPPPINGAYPPGTTVNFCYTVSKYLIQGNNWFHGIVPKFGPGWDTTTLQPKTPPASCFGGGQWNWYNSVTSSKTGLTVGPGYFYKIDTMATVGSSFGDKCTSHNWTFCWSITTLPDSLCVNGTDLSLVIENYADGESGGWKSTACVNDPNYKFNAILYCCDNPIVSSMGSMCAGDSAAFASAQGLGTAPWDYNWIELASNSSVQNSIDVAGADTLSGIPPGQYAVFVSDSFGCGYSDTVVIPPPVEIITTATVDHVSCDGNSDGSIDLSIVGGDTPFSFQWSGGQSSEDIGNLVGGTYFVTVTDSNGCSAHDTFTVLEPTPINLSVIAQDISCYGLLDGMVQANVNGGTGPYSFLWNTGNTGSVINNTGQGSYCLTVTDQNGCTAIKCDTVDEPPELIMATGKVDESCSQANGLAYVSVSGGTPISGGYIIFWDDPQLQTGDTAYGLSAGTYNVTVSDGNGCSKQASVMVNSPNSPNAFVQSVVNVSCNGMSNGTVDIEVNGGVAPYTYNWSNGPATQDLSSVPAGSYGLLVTDDIGCTDSVNVTIVEPAALSLATSSADNDCYGDSNGSASVNVAGGSFPYSYLWSNSSTASTTGNLTSGTYKVTVTDNKGCTDSALVTINGPDALTLASGAIPATCGSNNGSAFVSVAGGQGPYVYQWNDPMAQQTDTAVNLATGVYHIAVTDSNNCTVSDTVQVNASLTGTPSVLNIRHVTCAGLSDGEVTIQVTGGNPPFLFQWDDPQNQSSETATNLSAGTYHVGITDSLGCYETLSVAITEPPALITSVTAQNITCNGYSDGKAVAAVNGGALPYNLSWSDGASGDSLQNLAPGVYSLTVTDNNGCITIDSFNIAEPQVLAATTAAEKASCFEGKDGAIYLTVTGGTAPYQYSWSNQASTKDNTGLPKGSYSVTIIDNNGCQFTISDSVHAPPEIAYSLTADDVTCYDGNDGWITLDASGGTQPLSFRWSTGESADEIGNIKAGQYSFTITDANNCTKAASVFINQPPEIFIDLSEDQTIKLGDEVALFAHVDDWNRVKNYFWNPSISLSCQDCPTPVAKPKDNTTYVFNIKDYNNCAFSDSVTIQVLIEPYIYIPNAFTPNSDGLNDEFRIYTRKLKAVDFKIFSRQGERLWETSDPQKGWGGYYKGILLNPGAYVYSIRVTFPDDSEKLYHGTVTLIR